MSEGVEIEAVSNDLETRIVYCLQRGFTIQDIAIAFNRDPSEIQNIIEELGISQTDPLDKSNAFKIVNTSAHNVALIGEILQKNLKQIQDDGGRPMLDNFGRYLKDENGEIKMRPLTPKEMQMLSDVKANEFDTVIKMHDKTMETSKHSIAKDRVESIQPYLDARNKKNVKK